MDGYADGDGWQGWRPEEATAATSLLNCLVRELTEPRSGAASGYRLTGTGRTLTTGAGRWPQPPLAVDGLILDGFDALVVLAEEEARARTGVDNATLGAEMRDSRDVVAALLAARAEAAARDEKAVADLYLRSEQALLAGHRYHPAPKTRGGTVPQSWLPYAAEAGARYPLTLLGVREDLLGGEGVSGAIDALWGDAAPPGYRVLPAHPWQLELLRSHPTLAPQTLTALADGRIRDLGRTEEQAWATSSLRTVYLPDADLALKFSLEVRITNDIRRLWLRDLRWLQPVDEVLAALPPALSSLVFADQGYRTLAGHGEDGWEAYAVLQREGFAHRVAPGLTPLLAAGVSEGFDGNPLDRLTAEQAFAWWRRYVELLAPPALDALRDHGVVLECHLQNVLVAVDAAGLPGQVLFRDHEGVKLTTDRHASRLTRFGPGVPNPGVSPEYGRDRLLYCLVVNNLMEMAGAITARHPQLAAELWPTACQILSEYRDFIGVPHIPAKTNLLLRWLDADGGDSTYVPLPNPLAQVQR
ncbi:IucA/IucC family protein [Streptacidiphilus fuscans]|uniref:IucA/IucC family siderophore biosynthesis protein n=1 Tax=Streptacidiphilus fuscans TaxID=2789292 RepID=A0A931FGS2_9ACTN|nr:IucA/IucC family protein [Streptacidiphilus fuscans]MBF9071570.1 IucA/IucC family siderophore biosynthesis protein [Streptacidiphilus fuscans]